MVDFSKKWFVCADFEEKFCNEKCQKKNAYGVTKCPLLCSRVATERRSVHPVKKTLCRERLFTWVAYDRLSCRGKGYIYAALPLCHRIICEGGSCQEHRGIMSSWPASHNAGWPLTNAPTATRRRKMQKKKTGFRPAVKIWKNITKRHTPWIIIRNGIKCERRDSII